MIAKIVQTAKQTVNAKVESQSARACSFLSTTNPTVISPPNIEEKVGDLRLLKNTVFSQTKFLIPARS
jgi:hypothetical protein